MKRAYTKDILRTIRKNAKRFLAIMAITALGLTAFSGITAACRDMYLAADRFYDEQRLFDIRVLSTLGLTNEDLEALQDISGVETADAGYSETVYTTVDGLRQKAEVTMLSAKGLNTPYLVEGTLPQQAGEIAVTQKYLDESGKTLGDIILIEEDLEDADDPEPMAKDTKPGEENATTSEEGEDEKGLTTDIDWDADIELEEEEETPTFQNTQYTITAVVIDPMDIANNEGTTAFRSTAITDYSFFVTAADVNTDVYTSIYLALHGLAGLDCYSDGYVNAVQAVIDRIETEIMKQRQQARHSAVMAEALEKITDAEATMDEKFSEADEKFSDAWAEIEEAKQELIDGEAKLTKEECSALKKLADARAELEDGKNQLRDAEAQLNAGQAELDANADILEEGREELEEQRLTTQAGFAKAEQAFADEQAKLNTSRDQLAQAEGGLKAAFEVAGIDYWPAAEWSALVNAAAGRAAGLILASPDNPLDFSTGSAAANELAAATATEQNALAQAIGAALMAGVTPPGGQSADEFIGQCVQTALGLGVAGGGQSALDTQRQTYDTQKALALQKLAEAEAKLDSAEEELEEGRRQLDAGRAEIAQSWADLNTGEDELNAEETKALRKLAEAWQEIADGKQELADGEAELAENEEKYLDKRTEAEEKIADAYAELADIDMAQWYVQDRTSIDSYSSLDSDLGSIDAIGRVFPILFLVVAVLISLTTLTRMVEEERGLIGTYKALGFSDLAIGRKYVLYALLASLAGSVAGNILGFAALPQVLIVILGAIYVLPSTPLYFDIPSAALGTGLFTLSIVLATALACQSELRQSPAALMRPKSPRAGSRILLERISPVWNRLKFLNKVTARNLFRYKKRLLMTVIGIAGCTALVLAGFAIRDSVTELEPKQYEHIYRYDLLVVVDTEDHNTLTAHLEQDPGIADYLPAQVETAKVINAAGTSESMQMIVIPEGQQLDSYIYTPDVNGQSADLEGSCVLITQNAAGLLGLEAGDTAFLQNLRLDRFEVTIGAVVENYLGNAVYLPQTLYEALFGAWEPNAAYAHFTEAVADQPAYAEELLDEKIVLSSVSTAALKEQFTTDFAILNYVIYILLVLAAGLAFVVLFTLSNTNISERIRELATIKVLGFFDREVHAYVNKETLILTMIGVLAGLPLGYLLSGLLLATLKMPALEFALYIRPQSYLIAGVISFSFALLVNLITNRVLDKINMVEALKSVE